MRPAAGLLTCVLVLSAALGCSGARDPLRTASSRAPPSLLSSAPPVSPLAPSDDSILAVGESVYLRGQFDSARGPWQPALRRARAAHDSLLEARLLTWLGLAAYRQGNYPEAHRLGEDALALKSRLGSAVELSRSYNALGLLAWNEGRLVDATGLFEKASETAGAAADESALAKAFNNLALVLTELGDFKRARNGFLAAREAGRSLGDARIEGGALSNLAMLDIQTGDPLPAVGALEEARRLYRSIRYETGEQNSLGQLGTAYRALGQPRLALAALDTALSLARKQGLRQEEASNLELIAELYSDAGDPRRALQLYAEAKAVDAELGLDVERGTDLRAEAEIHAGLGRPTLALQYATDALAIHRRAGARLQELRDHLFLAEVAARSGESQEAASHLRSADRLTAALEARLARVETGLAKARIADRAGDSRGVLRPLAAVRADLARGGYGTEWQAAMLAARAHARLGEFDSAVAVGRRAVAAVERVRANFGSGFLRSSYVVDKSAPYTDLVDVLLQVGRTDEAFEVADGLRGRALLEHLAATADEERLPTATLRSFAQGEALLRRIDLLASRQDALEETPPAERDAATTDQIYRLAGEIGRARSAYEALLVQVTDRDAVGSALLGARRVSATEVRAALQPGEALLEYLATPERVVLFVVTGAGVRGVDSPVAVADLESRSRVARGLLARPPRGLPQDLSVLDSLYDALVAPAVRAGALKEARRLIIVPHSFLSYLPFAALRSPATRRYLVEDFTLVHLASAAALPVLRDGARASEAGAPGPAKATVFAPLPKLLPATRREAIAVRRAIGQAELYLGPEATEPRIRTALGEPAIVHVASHGVMNPRNPMFSHVALAQSGTSRPGDDGRLELHEVLGLRIRSPLVFLSGCETGVGAAWSTGFARGEDYGTLAQAFLYAGARSVIATLWPIEDEGAAVFADRFYGQLSRVPAAEALADAQRAMLRDPSLQAPYYWAAYQVTGDGREIPVPHAATARSVKRE